MLDNLQLVDICKGNVRKSEKIRTKLGARYATNEGKVSRKFQIYELLWYPKSKMSAIRSVHPSESLTITAFRREPAGQNGECLFNEC